MEEKQKTVEALLYYIMMLESRSNRMPCKDMFIRLERDVAQVDFNKGFVLDKSLTYRTAYAMDKSRPLIEKAEALRKVYQEQGQLGQELDIAVKTLAKNLIENLG